MKFSQLTVAVAATSLVSAAPTKELHIQLPKIDIHFRRWAAPACLKSGDESKHDISYGKCQNFDNVVTSFLYRRDHHFFRPWHNHDFDSPLCFVALFENLDCTGKGFSVANFPNTVDKCWESPFNASSATVRCDASVMPGPFTRDDEGFATQASLDPPTRSSEPEEASTPTDKITATGIKDTK